MKWIFALVLALLYLAPAAQAHGHFRGGYGHGGYGYASFASYSLFTPYIPVQAVYAVPVAVAAPVVDGVPLAVAEPVCAPTYSTGFSGYAGSYGFSRGFYGRNFFRRPGATVPAKKVIRRQ